MRYAGNFERQLGAWMIGKAGECGVGEDEATAAVGSMGPAVREWLDDHTMATTADNGGTYYASIWKTPGWFNDGLGNEWPDDADPDVVATKYAAARAKNNLPPKEVTRHPAYMSVAVFFDIAPPADVLAFMVAQVATFNARSCRGKFDGDITSTGAHLIKIDVVETAVVRGEQ